MLPVIDIDLNEPAFIANPYPRLAELRESAPIFLAPRWQKAFFTRYDDIAAILRDRRFGRQILHVLARDELGWPPPSPLQRDFDAFQERHLLDREPPDHTRLRRLLSKAFTPQRVEGLRPKIVQVVEELLDGASARGEVDLTRDLAEPLPVIVIAELLGVPESDRHRLRPWSAAIVKLYELGYSDEQARQANQAVVEFSAYLAALAQERRAHPRDDLISALVQVEDEGQLLSEDELVANCILLLNAGHEATVNGTSLGLLALFRNPDQLARLVEAASSGQDALFKTAVDELLRFESPLPMFERWVLEDVDYRGARLAKGSEVGLFYASGNRDGRKFPQPDRLDVGRADNQHLTFGLGIHYCLGAPLARLEMAVALETLLRRFPRLRPAFDLERPAFGSGFVIRGLRELPVVLE
jgi:unspecific monooxygenase